MIGRVNVSVSAGFTIYEPAALTDGRKQMHGTSKSEHNSKVCFTFYLESVKTRDLGGWIRDV